MRIVFDCRSVFAGMGGIGRAAASLARELPRAVSADDEVLLLLGARRPEAPLAEAPNARLLATDAAMIDPIFEQIHLPGLLEEVEADIYHGTCFSVPIAAGRAMRVATVHDVVFRRRPELVEPGLRDYLDRWTGVSCDVADAVVTVSEFSRREIATLYGRPAERIDVVSNAVDEERFRAQTPAAPRDGPPYLLYVGSIEPKKNVEALVRAFQALCRRAPDLPHELRLAGSGRLPEGFEPGPRVRLLGHVAEDRLPGLYAGADLFCYLSEYEGFGLPPLEAMSARVPCLVADRASLPEITSGGALLADPSDAEAVAVAMERALRDDRLRAELQERGWRAVQRYSWRASALKLVSIYRRVMSAAPEPALVGGAA